MPQFIASTSRGLVDALESELQELSYKIIGRNMNGVMFEKSWQGAYRACLQSRLASRIMRPVLDFTAYQPEELYGQVQTHDFTKYIKPDQTIAVDASVRDGKMNDQRFIAMKVKDAIVDQFRDKFGVRPDVEKHGADLVIQVRAVKNQFSLSVDLSGESLFKRGYRKEALEAPLKENLAAGLLRLAEWDRITPIVDPMCGSGTILIEAAMMALNMAPGSHRKNFGFQNWLNFDEEAWEKVLDEAAETEKQDLDFKLFGFDIDRKAISIAKANAKVAGVDHVVEFKSEPVATLNPPVPEGMIVTNPPYGARIGDEDNLRDVYRDLSYTLKNRFPGWTAWILAGNKDLVSDLKLKSTRKFQVFNGNIECRLLKYEIQQR